MTWRQHGANGAGVPGLPGEVAGNARLGYGLLMHPTFKYESTDIASVTAVKLSGRPAMGGAVLVVGLQVMTQPKLPAHGELAPRIVMIGGRITAVAPLAPVLGNWQCVNYAQSHTIVMDAYLTHAQVRAVDEARDEKGDINLLLSFDALVNGRAGQLPSFAQQNFGVTMSDWTRVLTEMRFEDRATFEVPVERGRVGPPLDKAAAHLKTALDRVQQRQWPDALKACREVLDELQQFQAQPTPAWADWADKAKREGWDVAQRLVVAQAALRHLTHAGAHAAIGNADEQGVRLAVTMTAAVLRYYASR